MLLISNHFRFAFAHVGRVGSTFATMIVTIERFIAIVYPFRAIRKNMSLTLMSYCLVFSIIYNIPRFLEFRTASSYEIENSLHEEDITDNQTINKENSEVYISCYCS